MLNFCTVHSWMLVYFQKLDIILVFWLLKHGIYFLVSFFYILEVYLFMVVVSALVYCMDMISLKYLFDSVYFAARVAHLQQLSETCTPYVLHMHLFIVQGMHERCEVQLCQRKQGLL